MASPLRVSELRSRRRRGMRRGRQAVPSRRDPWGSRRRGPSHLPRSVPNVRAASSHPAIRRYAVNRRRGAPRDGCGVAPGRGGAEGETRRRGPRSLSPWLAGGSAGTGPGAPAASHRTQGKSEAWAPPSEVLSAFDARRGAAPTPGPMVPKSEGRISAATAAASCSTAVSPRRETRTRALPDPAPRRMDRRSGSARAGRGRRISATIAGPVRSRRGLQRAR